MEDLESARIDHSPVTLHGEEGRQVAQNVAAISVGRMTVCEAGPAFSLDNSGTLCIDLDQATAAALDKIGMYPKSTD